MTYHVQFPGLGLALTVNRVAVSIGGFNIYWYGIIIAAGSTARSSCPTSSGTAWAAAGSKACAPTRCSSAIPACAPAS